MTSRRAFLSGLGAAAVAARPFALVGAASSPRRPRLALQVYAVRDLCARDFPGTLKAARALGFEGIETGRFYGRDGAGLRTVCAEAGLELVALQLYPSALVEPELARTIRFCRAAGTNRINVAWFKGSAENPNDWQLLVDVVNHAAEVCAAEGIAIGYHNHDQEFRIRFDGRTVCDWLFERFAPGVQQEFDPGWCVLAGADPLAWLSAHPHRNPTMHLMPAIEGVGAGAPAGFPSGPGACGLGAAGDRADWRHLVPAIVVDGTEWLVVKPTAYPGSLADAAASRRYLNDILG
ncbi:MAG: sugar phosphate isomerase/epimerase family protein [Kiritimatiellia bacterium]